jgi:hypothetical protein
MEYKGRYECFPAHRIRTYPVAERTNKVSLKDLANPVAAAAARYDAGSAEPAVVQLAHAVIASVREQRPVICFFGAHLVKNGLGPLLADLVRRRVFSLVATNGAGVIHDFELALIGQTSEYVPRALPEGMFGMAAEFGYINATIAEGEARKLGCGEALGRCLCDDEFRTAVERRPGVAGPITFAHREVSLIAAAYEASVPLTVHVGIGTDVIDQHSSFDGAAKGGCSGRDFLIYTEEVTRLAGGGVVLNVSSAVTGPEVLLKAVSMAANIGRAPAGIITGDFDLKPYHHEHMTDERSADYYVRHHKSIATRVPEAFGGKGYYVQGDHRATFPRLYQEIIKGLADRSAS